jgi:hypothetical protein
MLSLPPSVRVFVATQPIDGRKGADSLMAIVRDLLGHDPLLCVVVRNVARGCSASGNAGPSAALAQTNRHIVFNQRFSRIRSTSSVG